MPNILFGLAGMGQGGRGARSADAERQKLQANELALERARRQMAEEEADRRRQEGFRKGMAEALTAIGSLEDLSRKKPDLPTITPKSVGESYQEEASKAKGPLGVALKGAQGALERVMQHRKQLSDVEGWLKGKDDATAKAISNIQQIAARVAEDDPEAALWVMQQGRQQLQGRVMQAAIGSIQRRGSDLIRALNNTVAAGRVSEDFAKELQGRLQSVMEMAETDPSRLADAEQALNAAFQAIDKEMSVEDSKALALTELEWYRGKPGGFDAKVIDQAKRYIELNVDPEKVLTFVRGTANTWTGGYLKDAPDRIRSQWKAKAMQASRQFAAEILPYDKLTYKNPSDYIKALREVADEYLPMFLQEAQLEAGVIDPRADPEGTVHRGMGYEPDPTQADIMFLLEQQRMKQAQGAAMPGAPAQPQMAAPTAATPTAQHPVSQSFSTQTQGGPAMGPGMQPIDPSAMNAALAQGAGTAAPTAKKSRLERLKIRKGEDPKAFVDRVVAEVRKVGGSREDVLDVLEANGISPEMLSEQPSKSNMDLPSPTFP